MKPPATHYDGPVIEMKDVSVPSMRDQETVVAEHINWVVKAGETWVIGGLHGAGKTDLLLMTGGLIGPAAGEYRLFGQKTPIFDERRLPERLRLGLVFEGTQLFNQLTVSENIALPLRYHHNLSRAAAHDRVQQFLEQFELAPWADSTPGAISRSWQKRAGLARALILQPELLLVDNPLGGLDLPHAAWILNALQKLSQGWKELGLSPLTLIVTAADFRPWKSAQRRFAMLRQKEFMVIGSWEALEQTTADWASEVLAAEFGEV